MPRNKRTVLIISHFDPSQDINGAKSRLISLARAISSLGYRPEYVNYKTDRIYHLGVDGYFRTAGVVEGELRSRENVACILALWAAHTDAISEYIEKIGLHDPHVPVALDTIDSVSVRQYRDYAATKHQLPSSDLMVSKETESLRKHDWVIAITDEERALFASLTQTPSLVISYSDPDLSRPEHRTLNERRFLEGEIVSGFMGSRNYANYHAAIRSCHVAWMSGIVSSFHLAGSVCRYDDLMDQLRIRYGNWLVVRGFVESPRSFYEPLHFTTNILPYGSGIKIKVIESLAYNRPVIGNHIALEGLTEYVDQQGPMARAETYLEYRDVLRSWLDQGTSGGDRAVDVARRQDERFQKQVGAFLDLVVSADPAPKPYRFGRTRLRQIIAGITRSGGR